ncbi:hypothetical protein [Streptomyces sp. NPDC003023]|uniref:hypothetical protein n=1 Tax=Streptomyces sp. NPDC003023 TaxID=3364675 RepID=UPI0036BAB2FF
MLPWLSSACLPTDGLPGRLRTAAERNPVSAVSAAVRELFGNAAPPADAARPVAHPVADAVCRSPAPLALRVPLAVRRLTRS